MTAQSVDDAVQLAPLASVVVVGLGHTDDGIGAAQEIFSRGVTIPSLVVGDTAAPAGGVLPVLSRPFTLDDLRSAVERIAAPPGVHLVRAEPAQDDLEEGVNVIDLERERMIRIEPQDAGEESPAPVQESPPVAPSPPVQPTSGPAPAPAPAAQAQPDVVRRDDRKKLRRRKAAEVPAPQAESPVVQRMRAVAAVGPTLEELLDELPMLADLQSMTHALLGEVVSLFSPEIASVYIRREGKFHVVASHGLSRIEHGLVVSEDHPLFGDMVKAPEALLIAPVDLAQGLVAGIGGARTEALLVAPVEVDGRCVAIIVVGSSGFADADLDALDDLAREAAPGLAVAQLLSRIRGA